MGRLLTLGDVHGDVVALHQVLERANVTPDDLIIVLGDICDGFRHTKEVIDTLLSLNTLVCLGNHDGSTEGSGRCDYGWFLGWCLYGDELPIWVNQGGRWTQHSYDYDRTNVPQSHIDYLLSAKPYHIINNKVFCHGGFDPLKPIEKQDPEYIMWDRKLCVLAQYNIIKEFDEVYVGHTCVRSHNKLDLEPIFYNNLIMMDTGSGWYGKLTIMDADTHQFWQSDLRDISNEEHNV